jgi:hypothetical protein
MLTIKNADDASVVVISSIVPWRSGMLSGRETILLNTMMSTHQERGAVIQYTYSVLGTFPITQIKILNIPAIIAA